MTSQVWLNSANEIILQGGSVTVCDECPCDPPSDSSESESDSVSECLECYDPLVICGDVVIAYPFTLLVNGELVEMTVTDDPAPTLEGTVDIPGCGTGLTVTIEFTEDCEIVIGIGGVGSTPMISPSGYESDPLSLDAVIDGGSCGDIPVSVINGGTPDGCTPIWCSDSSDSDSDPSGSGSDSSSDPCEGITGLYSTGELTSSGSGCDFDDAWGHNVTVPNGNWATPAGASWIGPVCDSVANPQPKDDTYTYSLTFNIPAGTDLTCLKIYGQWSSDNSTTEVRVNGNVTGYSCGFFCLTSLHDYEFGEDVLQIGDNTIEFDVDNGPDHLTQPFSPTGFTASIHCKVDCGSGSGS
jgi:hypothetical protein